LICYLQAFFMLYQLWKIKEIKRKNNNFLDSVSYFGLRRK
jgi:hypothetical protein